MFLLAYITYPLSFLQTALKQVKAISIVSMIVPVVYWSVICLLIDTYGLYSFAFSKLLAFAISVFCMYIVFTVKYSDWLLEVYEYTFSSYLSYIVLFRL